MNDMARFLGALHRYSGSSVNAIKYGSDKYVWNDEGRYTGSNWVKDGEWSQTLVAQVTAALKDSLLKNYAGSIQLGISTDGGSTYSTITLKSVISTATITRDGKKLETSYSLKSALEAAQSGDTVTMTSDCVTNEQLSLPAGVTLEGGNHTLTHLSNPSGTANDQSAAIVLASDENGDDDEATIQNLKVVGPNTTPATTNADGTVTQNWNSGEYAIKAWGANADLTVKNVEISHAQSALMASKGATLTVEGSLKMSDLEYGGIEVSESDDSELILSYASTISYTGEYANAPFAWVDNGGKIINNTMFDLTKVDKTQGSGNSKAHYYLGTGDKSGLYYYTGDASAQDTLSASKVVFDGDSEFALVKFTPSTSGNYYFASAGTVDAVGELYTLGASGLGDKIAKGDDEQNPNFRIVKQLTAGTTYVLKVYANFDDALVDDAVGITLSAGVANDKDLSNYAVELPSSAFYYSNDSITAAKLSPQVKSLVNGNVLSSDKYTKTIYESNDDGTIKSDATVTTITKAGTYYLKVTSANNDGLTGEAFCSFYVYNSTDIEEYNFEFNKSLVYNGKPVSISMLAPKGYRWGSSNVTFDEKNLKVGGWYEIDKYGFVADDAKPLSSAPSAVGKYALRVYPLDNSGFDTSKYVDLVFSITKGKIAAPVAKTGLTYTGKAQTGVATGTGYKLSGTYSATNAGTYTCTATLDDGYTWSDGTTAAKTITWSIAKAKIAVPTAAANLAYTGKAQTGVAAGIGYKLSGTTQATEPGSYSCTATLDANYTWTDGTTATKTVKWSIAKAAVNIIAVPATVMVKAGGTATIALSQAGTASYSVSTSDTKVASASVSGTNLNITAVGSGTATITVSTAATARYEAGSCTVTVNVPKAAGTTGATTETVIDASGKAQTVSNTYKVTKAADLDNVGVVPTVAFTGSSASGAVAVPASVTLGDGVTYKVTSVAADAFYGSKVTAVTIPDSVTKIGASAFEECDKLKSVTLPASIKTIGKNAFRDCTKLRAITLPAGVKTVGVNAFNGCTKLAKVVVNSGKIYKGALRNCKNLKTVTIGAEVTAIGANVLRNTAATKVTLKSAKLSKASIKNLVKGSKITTVKCTGLSKKVKAKYAKWAKAYKAGVKFK